MFRKLVENINFRNKFINYVADQLNTSFLPSVIINKINEYKSKIEFAIQEHINRWNVIKSWEDNIDILRRFAKNRSSYMRKHIIKNFINYGVNKVFIINIDLNSDMGYININSITLNKLTLGVNNPNNWSGKYFNNIPIYISTIPYDGYVFDHWEGINDQVSIYNKEITLILDSNISIKAIFKEKSS
ncbi:MAG: CotH kinase family protein [Clostridiales bacterium]